MTKLTEDWEITLTDKETLSKLSNVTLIEGLPGIGNVGKVVVDFLIEQLSAKKIGHIFSYQMPHTVFVGEDNLVTLPSIELFTLHYKGKDFLLLTGDVQPTSEISSYTFCETILSNAKEWSVKNIITLGGIGLQETQEEPQVYSTGNDLAFIDSFIEHGANNEVYSVVGPIIGVSGLLLGMAKQHAIPAVALLAETLGHPMHLGLRAAKSTLTLLKSFYDFDYSFDDLDEEIEQMESDEEPKEKDDKKKPTLQKLKKYKDISYIG